jgi:streptogramin lyase
MCPGVAVGADGNLWFTEISATEVGNKIGKITTADQITEFDNPTAGALAHRITAGPDGNLLAQRFNGDGTSDIFRQLYLLARRQWGQYYLVRGQQFLPARP